MAPKPKKEMTDAQKAKLKKMLSQGGNLDKAAKERAAAKKNAPLGKPTTKEEMAAAQKRLLGKGAMKDGSLSIDQKMARNAAARKKRQATAYSPAPMSAAAKAKAAAAGKATGAKTKKNTSVSAKVNKVAGSVAKRVKTVAREGRDVVTAAGTLAKTIKNVKPSQGGGTPTVKSQRAIGQAGSNLGKQIKEVGSAIISGKSGTTSAQSKVKREVIPGKKRK